MGFAGIVRSSLDSDGPCGGDALNDYSGVHFPIAVIAVTSCTTCQEDVIAKWSEFARMETPKYVAAHRKRVRNKAEGRATVGSLELLPSSDGDEMVATTTKTVRARSFCKGAR